MELSAFDKVMLECNQEEPVKFTEFLDARYIIINMHCAMTWGLLNAWDWAEWKIFTADSG